VYKGVVAASKTVRGAGAGLEPPRWNRRFPRTVSPERFPIHLFHVDEDLVDTSVVQVERINVSRFSVFPFMWSGEPSWSTISRTAEAILETEARWSLREKTPSWRDSSKAATFLTSAVTTISS
jgi:hypothetical protein